MTLPKCVPVNHDAETKSQPEDARQCNALQHDLPDDVFDQNLFEDMRNFLGNAEMRLSLIDLSASLQQGLPDITAQFPDRDEIFQSAHTMGARAGMMGFVALRDACWQLQHALSTGAIISPAYIVTQDAAIATRHAIAVLQQRLS